MNQPQILYEDDFILVINKPAGLVVHEGAGETGATLVDWFVQHYPAAKALVWEEPFRAGITHRLDKDTSGVMVLSKTPEVLAILQAQFQDRSTQKVYKALVFGMPREERGVIETFIGRHPQRRQEQAVLPIQVGDRARREAITEYQLSDHFFYKKDDISLLTFYPKTGRMHQLRVHAKYLGTPILGDPTYNTKPSKRVSKELGLTRQLLHAISLTFTHPKTGERVSFKAPFPADIQGLIEKLSA